MSQFEQMSNMSNILFTIVPIFIGIVFIVVIAMMVSPKLRGKMLSRQIKSVKYMTDFSKQDLEDIGTNLGNVSVTIKKKVIDQNGEVLEEISTKNADINSEAVRKMAESIKEGFGGTPFENTFTEKQIYCKHCGASIDEDSKYCKKCGQRQ